MTAKIGETAGRNKGIGNAHNARATRHNRGAAAAEAPRVARRIALPRCGVFAAICAARRNHARRVCACMPAAQSALRGGLSAGGAWRVASQARARRGAGAQRCCVADMLALSAAAMVIWRGSSAGGVAANRKWRRHQWRRRQSAWRNGVMYLALTNSGDIGDRQLASLCGIAA